MTPEQTALILIGYQNDYFADDGILHGVLENPARTCAIKQDTVDLISALAPTATTIISTPILFTPDYRELVDPVGILKTIQEVGAFQADSPGGATIPEFARFGDRILVVPGKRGLNAFSNTSLHDTLTARGIQNIVIAGVVTSICVDSTGRHASDTGLAVSVLSDCTGGRSAVEQQFYCENIFPLYAQVLTSKECAGQLGVTLCPTEAIPTKA